MIGTLMTPTSASTAPARSARRVIVDRCLQGNESDVEKEAGSGSTSCARPKPTTCPTLVYPKTRR